MQTCKFCGKFILTSYNQHLAIAHPREWDKIKNEWVRLRNEGMSAKDIAERYDTNSATVSRAVKDRHGPLSKAYISNKDNQGMAASKDQIIKNLSNNSNDVLFKSNKEVQHNS